MNVENETYISKKALQHRTPSIFKKIRMKSKSKLKNPINEKQNELNLLITSSFPKISRNTSYGLY